MRSIRAKPLIMWPPIAKREAESGREQRRPHIPKKEIRSDAGGELAIRRSKIERCKPNLHPFRIAFSGIDCGRRLVPFPILI